ncbi:cation:proton antiporter [Microbaculum sp. FT89]|uniref:cation:proton antiporter n=1 Tax=Microbaculum sp. FT89 TaxID=3447298 RepID=UPI003F538D69
MHHHTLLIFFALLIFAFGLFSRLAERKSVTGPMVFVAVGVLVSPLGLGLLDVHPEIEPVRLVAELALTLVLFTDASLIDIKALRKAPAIPARLLLIGLPLTMLSGIGLGALMFGSASLLAIVLMGLILSPTDAALGQAVVKSKSVPLRIRQSISVESGLNDGIALPPIIVCLVLLGAEAGDHQNGVLGFVARQVTLGPLAGLAVGWVGGKLIQFMADKGWMEETFQRLSALPLAILAYTIAESVGGNGFIAAFFAGLGLTVGAPSAVLRHRIQEFAETEGTQLILVVFLLFGISMVPAAVPYWGLPEVIYALASLSVIRMVPVAISLIGARLDWQSVAFIGWFGPRGIASVLYLLIAVSVTGFAGYEQVMSVIVLTVVFSVFAHGVTAMPLSELYGATQTAEQHPTRKT